MRGAFFIYTGRTAGENDPFRGLLLDFARANVVPNDLGIDLAFAHPPRDDLGVLRTEIENENSGMRRCFHWSMRSRLAGGWRNCVFRMIERHQVSLTG